MYSEKGHAATPFPVEFRLRPPYFQLSQYAEPGTDEFRGERPALELESNLREAVRSGLAPVKPGLRGRLPFPKEYQSIGPGVLRAVYEGDGEVASGWKAWLASMGKIRRAQFYRLPGDVLRYDIRSENRSRLEHRIGSWKCGSEDGALTWVEPVEEFLTFSEKPWFRDVTAYSFASEPAFEKQFAKGVPYWRSGMDPACGIDLYGENGIAAADIDGDGQDEIFVCQPGGLPNRLLKFDSQGRARDISKEAGLDLLDDTTGALFVDLRNSGHQDLVLVTINWPMLFLNDGKGRFRLVEDAFRFGKQPQGTFTSVAAADFDRDGRLDLYFCSYVYFQSEAQYRYPVPYHDAQNGPRNYLFKNRLDTPKPHFEDVTAESGMDHNNNRFSFAATWCDYNFDGWPDVYVTNDFGRNNLYKNEGGKFRDVAADAGLEDMGPGMSAAWLDYDGDGKPDLLVSNMWSACGQRVVNDPAFGVTKQDPSVKPFYQRHVKGDSLYRNNGDGTFEYVGDKEGVEIVPWSWSCDGCDFDNDGTPEIYIACGMLTNNNESDLMSYFYRQVVSKSPPSYRPAPGYEEGWNSINQLVRQEYSWAGSEPNVFFVRRGGRFHDFSGVSGLDLAEDSRAFAFVDIDGDGNLDLVLKSRLAPQVRVFQNACGVGRGSIGFQLRGTKSNRDAIGARVEVDGQVKWVMAGSAYISQHTKKLYFGLGDKRRAQKVRIVWPSGLEQDLGSRDSGSLYEVTEGDANVKETRFRARVEWPASDEIRVDNEAKLRTTWMWEPVPLPERRTGPALVVLHAGESIPRLPVSVQEVDLRKIAKDIVAGYAIFRRYLFEYRRDLETPLWMLIDREGRLRKVYEDTPSAAEAEADVRSLGGPLPDPRGLPLEGKYVNAPRRDYYKFGGALLQAGYYEPALPYLEEVLRRNPDNAKALLAVGRIHLQGNRLPQARESLRRALAINPSTPEGWNELGGVESASGDQAAAMAAYEKALSLAPDLPYALINMAHAQEKLGKMADAESYYLRALSADSKNGDAANGLGLLLAKQGRTAEAKKLFEQAISIRRDDSSAINNLGVLYLNTGQVNDAIAAFQYGIQAAPDDELLYMNLARVWVKLGEREKAKDVMRSLQARKPDSEMAKVALKALESQ